MLFTLSNADSAAARVSSQTPSAGLIIEWTRLHVVTASPDRLTCEFCEGGFDRKSKRGPRPRFCSRLCRDRFRRQNDKERKSAGKQASDPIDTEELTSSTLSGLPSFDFKILRSIHSLFDSIDSTHLTPNLDLSSLAFPLLDVDLTSGLESAVLQNWSSEIATSFTADWSAVTKALRQDLLSSFEGLLPKFDSAQLLAGIDWLSVAASVDVAVAAEARSAEIDLDPEVLQLIATEILVRLVVFLLVVAVMNYAVIAAATVKTAGPTVIWFGGTWCGALLINGLAWDGLKLIGARIVGRSDEDDR